MESAQTPTYGELAALFAAHLTAGRYVEAHCLLSEQLKVVWPADALEREFSQMVESGHSSVCGVELINTMESWPTRKASDLGWAYVAISGEGFCEALTVIVARESDTSVIRELEWGRP